jgi:hypothetical protein
VSLVTDLWNKKQKKIDPNIRQHKNLTDLQNKNRKNLTQTSGAV